MKRYLSYLLFGVVAGLVYGCGDDGKEEPTPKPNPMIVNSLFSPANDADFEIANLETGLLFEWAAAVEVTTRADAADVTYRVAFDFMGGDFTDPVYTVASDNAGTSTSVTMSKDVLTDVVLSTGAEAGDEVTLTWAVLSTIAGQESVSPETRTLTLASQPEELDLGTFTVGTPLYISGEGSEAGQQFKYIDSEEYDYEIFTRIEAEKEYYFSTVQDGTGECFVVNDAKTGMKRVTSGNQSATAAGAVYCIRLNFATNTVTMNTIDHVWMRYCNATGRDVEFEYTGSGVWNLSNYNVILTTPNFSPQGEDRYKFIFQINGLAKSSGEHWGMLNTTLGGRHSLDAVPDGYYDLQQVGTGQWAGAFKFPQDFVDLNDLDRYYTDVVLYMNNDNTNYTHELLNYYDGTGVPAAYVNSIFTTFALPDPDVIRADDGYFYLYATESEATADAKNGPIMRSTDLINWTKAGTIFTDATHPHITDNPDARLWAPSVNRIGEKYVIYYSQPGKNYKHAIGVASSDSPTGPFVDHGKLIDSNEQGIDISIDAYLYQEDGRNYLFWGSFRKISILELTTDGLAIKDKETQVRTEVAGGQYEAAVVLKRDDYYYLIVSTGDYSKNGTYRLVVGRSDNIIGPYVNKSGKNMLDVNHELVLEGNKSFTSPGHCSRVITDDNGQDWILYHSYPTDKNFRCLMLDKIDWVDGWPVVVNKQPSSRAFTAPVFN